MINFNNYFDAGLNSTLRIKKGSNWSFNGQWKQVFTDTEIDRWYVGDFASASYQITVEFSSNKKEIINALVVARPNEASIVIYGRVSVDDDIITLSATVDNSYVSIKATAKNSVFLGAKVIFLATYAESIGDLTNPQPLSYLPENITEPELPTTPVVTSVSVLNDIIDVTTVNPLPDQLLSYNGVSWVNTDPAASANTFSSIVVAGQTTVTADIPNDILTLVAGTNMTLTTSGNAITINGPNLSTYATQTFVNNKFTTVNIFDDVDTVGSPASVGYVLKWNGSKWVPAPDVASGGIGADADTLDGFDSAYYLNYNNLLFSPDLSVYAPLSYPEFTDNVSIAGNLSLTTGTVTTIAITAGAEDTDASFTGRWTLIGTSRLTATYADLAENYTADEDYTPGTVVMFGGKHEITVADKDTRKIAGVVSDSYAYLMNENCLGEHVASVALQGRVKVKVKGTVEKGDMMISAGDGFAMASADPKLGQVIGKSLEDFFGSEGIIEVVVGRV